MAVPLACEATISMFCYRSQWESWVFRSLSLGRLWPEKCGQLPRLTSIFNSSGIINHAIIVRQKLAILLVRLFLLLGLGLALLLCLRNYSLLFHQRIIIKIMISFFQLLIGQNKFLVVLHPFVGHRWSCHFKFPCQELVMY